MSIGVTCPKCAWSGRAKDTLAGRSVKCPNCASPFRVGPRSEGRTAAGPAVTGPPVLPSLPPGPFSPAEAVALVTGNIRPVGTTIGYRLALALDRRGMLVQIVRSAVLQAMGLLNRDGVRLANLF